MGAEDFGEEEVSLFSRCCRLIALGGRAFVGMLVGLRRRTAAVAEPLCRRETWGLSSETSGGWTGVRVGGVGVLRGLIWHFSCLEGPQRGLNSILNKNRHFQRDDAANKKGTS